MPIHSVKLLTVISWIVLAGALFLLFVHLFAMSNTAVAATYTLMVPLPQFGTAPALTAVTGIADYIKGLYLFGLAIVSAIALAAVVIGGFIWVTAGAATGRVGMAKTLISNALLGLALLLSSYLILNTINPQLLQFREPHLGIAPPTFGGGLNPPVTPQVPPTPAVGSGGQVCNCYGSALPWSVPLPFCDYVHLCASPRKVRAGSTVQLQFRTTFFQHWDWAVPGVCEFRTNKQGVNVVPGSRKPIATWFPMTAAIPAGVTGKVTFSVWCPNDSELDQLLWGKAKRAEVAVEVLPP